MTFISISFLLFMTTLTIFWTGLLALFRSFPVTILTLRHNVFALNFPFPYIHFYGSFKLWKQAMTAIAVMESVLMHTVRKRYVPQRTPFNSDILLACVLSEC